MTFEKNAYRLGEASACAFSWRFISGHGMALYERSAPWAVRGSCGLFARCMEDMINLSA